MSLVIRNSPKELKGHLHIKMLQELYTKSCLQTGQDKSWQGGN